MCVGMHVFYCQKVDFFYSQLAKNIMSMDQFRPIAVLGRGHFGKVC